MEGEMKCGRCDVVLGEGDIRGWVRNGNRSSEFQLVCGACRSAAVDRSARRSREVEELTLFTGEKVKYKLIITP